ncbi:MAG: chorismate mutase [Bacteroidota bacterium]
MEIPQSYGETVGQTVSGLSHRKEPLIIAGPCSAETPDQLIQTASALALDHRIDYFRAGIWKPRTTPDSFQGIGSPGLPWLQEVRKQTGLKVTTEVGSPKHVEEALIAEIDMLWIGARTVSNPFVIQEIADALRGSDVPVLVKNPLSPDIDLWEGAINRMVRAGIKEVGAIHRGFYWWGKSLMRNQPFWHIPLELRKRMPGLLLLNDPSHIAGKREFISQLAHRAMEHEFSGLMVEVHHTPDKAWSDAAQQLTPHNFLLLMDELFGAAPKKSSNPLLNELRAEVDATDEMLVWALSVRMELAEKIAEVKKEAGLNSLQTGRWQEVLENVKTLGTQSGMDPVFVEKVYNYIHQQSLSLQNGVLKSNVAQTKKEHNFVL